jgi:hypothetical protein
MHYKRVYPKPLRENSHFFSHICKSSLRALVHDKNSCRNGNSAGRQTNRVALSTETADARKMFHSSRGESVHGCGRMDNKDVCTLIALYYFYIFIRIELELYVRFA